MGTCLGALLMLAALGTQAMAVPGGFNVQGRLTDSAGVNRNGTYELRSAIFDSAVGGQQLWTRTFSTATVRNGQFQALLGDVAGQPSLAQVFTGEARYLEIQVLSGPGIASPPEPPMAPRQQLMSVPYAILARSAETLPAVVAVATLTVTAGLHVDQGWAPDFETVIALPYTGVERLITVPHNLGARPRRIELVLSEREDGGGWSTPVNHLEHTGEMVYGAGVVQNNADSVVLYAANTLAFIYDVAQSNYVWKINGYLRVMLWK